MTILKSLMLGLGAVVASSAMAQTAGTTSVARDNPDSFHRVPLRNEVVGIRPQIGFTNFGSRESDSNTRMSIGVIAEGDALRWFGITAEGKEPNNWWIGPSTGLIYTHIGQTDTGFFGADSWPFNDLGSNVVAIPLNLKVAYWAIPQVRVGAHGGANLIYRSNSAAMQLQSNGEEGSNFTLLPNIGLDAEIPLGPGAITVRPDWTIAPGQDLITVAAGYSLSFG